MAEAEAGADLMAEETESLVAEARLPAYLTTDSDVSEDNVDLAHVFPIPGATHDDEAGTSATATTSNTPVPVPPPTVTTAVPNTLARILDTLTHQQGSMQAEQAHRHKVQNYTLSRDQTAAGCHENAGPSATANTTTNVHLLLWMLRDTLPLHWSA